MEKVFFKIIIPNYNNIQFIKECLDSILNQTFTDYKIIIVDDQSTDCSDKVCEVYAKNNPDKIVYLKANKKLYAGGCRNQGLQYPIKSDYIWFIDSDDWLYDANVLQTIYDNIQINNLPDVVRCSFIHWYGYNQPENRIQNETTSLKSIIVGNGAAPWKNIIASKFSNIEFKSNRAQWNDVVWFLDLYDQIDSTKISVVSTPCYVYNRANTTSSTNTSTTEECTQARIKLADDLKDKIYKCEYCNIEKANMIKKSNESREKIINISIEQFFKNSFVITIDKNRCQLFKKIFSTYNKILPTVSLGITSLADKVLNCAISHLEIVKLAKFNNLPFVVIFEDDAYPLIKLNTELKKYLSVIPADAGIVLFGWSGFSIGKGEQLFDKQFNKITTWIYGAHAYMIFQKSYDLYINYQQTIINTKNGKPTADNNIFRICEQAYVIDKPLYIQYCKNESMNSHCGYIFYGNSTTPPNGFPSIDIYK